MLAAAGTAAAGIILYLFNPEGVVWFPKCPFRLLTGLNCPSCGIQRALHQLLHLHPREAFMLNPFLAVALPYAALLLLVWLVPSTRIESLRRFAYHRATVWTFLAAMLTWWVVRNVVNL